LLVLPVGNEGFVHGVGYTWSSPPRLVVVSAVGGWPL
jgi:hypothetical protein